MKRHIHPATILLISLLLVFFGVAVTRSISIPSGKFSSTTGAAFFFQTTATPQPQQDRSEIGSTDGITLMSFAITAIIIIPIILQRKRWSQTSS